MTVESYPRRVWRRILPHSWPGWFGWFAGVLAAALFLSASADVDDGWSVVTTVPFALVVGLVVGTFWFGYARFEPRFKEWLHSDEPAEQSERVDELPRRALSAESLRALDARLAPHDPPAHDGVGSEDETRPRTETDDA